MAYVGHPNVRAKAMATQRFTQGSDPIWTDNETVFGRRAYCTTEIGSGNLLCGVFSSICIVFFNAGTMELVIDEYAKAKLGQIEILATFWADAGTFYPDLWTKNLDSSIQ